MKTIFKAGEQKPKTSDKPHGQSQITSNNHKLVKDQETGLIRPIYTVDEDN